MFQIGASAQTVILTTDLLDIMPKGTVVSYLWYLRHNVAIQSVLLIVLYNSIHNTVELAVE